MVYASAENERSRNGVCTGREELTDNETFYASLTPEERSRAPPLTKAKCVIMSGESHSPIQSSLSPQNFDTTDDVRVAIDGEKEVVGSTPFKSVDTERTDNAEVIEEEVTQIVTEPLQKMETQSRIARNGIDAHNPKKRIEQNSEESCVVNCVYYIQQCCECTIA